MKLVFATRKSALALAQSRAFVSLLKQRSAAELEIDELHVTTSGDRFVDQKLQDIGGKGLFIKELEEALLDGRADFAVHSIKDVPAELVPGLAIVCIPAREDPRDALVLATNSELDASRGLSCLPVGARIGTTSLRRAVCLQALRPDVVIEPLRGNVDSRIRKVDEGQYDAVVLAYAGLRRLRLEHRASIVLDPSECLPAVGQGALGIETRSGHEVERVLAVVDDEDTALCVEAERGLMAAVGGSCRLPIAAHAQREKADRMRLRAMVAKPDGTNVRTKDISFGWPTTREEARLAGTSLGAELGAG